MKNIILTIGITILKIFANVIYFIIKLFPIKNKVVMITRQSNKATLDFRLLKEYFDKNNPEIEVKILAKKLENGILEKLMYSIYILNIMYHLATSKVAVVDGYCIPVSILKHKNKLKTIQIWHASGAVKKFGYQILDKKEGSDSKLVKLMCMHNNYDYVIAPSEITKEFFAEAFNIPKEKIVELGLPRLEYISSPKYDKTEEIYAEYPELREKENILYVPTFRKDSDINLLEEILKTKINEKKYNLIIKLHPLDNTEVPEKYLIDKKYSSFDLIKIADYIITDYSALSIEASVLEKPIFLLLNDLNSYEKNRGLNINLKNELPSFVCSNFSDIIDKISNKKYNINDLVQYKNKYIEVDEKNTTKKLVEFILKLIQ